MNWLKPYMMIPYLKQGRTFEGCDCWGLVKLIYQRELGIEIPEYTSGYDDLSALIDSKRADWVPCEVEPLCVVVFVLMGEPCHTGVMIDDHQFIHCFKGVGIGIESTKKAKWNRRIDNYYKPKLSTT